MDANDAEQEQPPPLASDPGADPQQPPSGEPQPSEQKRADGARKRGTLRDHNLHRHVTKDDIHQSNVKSHRGCG